MSTTYDKYSDPGTILEFKNLKNTTKMPFTFIFDFERFLNPINENEGNIVHTQEHVPSAFALHCNSRFPEYQPEPIVKVKSSEQNMVMEFLGKLKEWVQEIHDKASNKKPLKLTEKETLNYRFATECWICNESFENNASWKYKKVRDHCHFTGEFRGAAHNTCNLKIQNNFTIPAIAHNLSKYDLKLFIRDLMKYTDDKRNVIAKSSEEFITVSIKIKVGTRIGKGGKPVNGYYTVKFIDSLKFLSGYLDRLVESGKEGCNDSSENFTTLKKYFPENYELLLRKGIYPYEYFTDHSKMLKRELPQKEEFYSKLTLSNIKDEE